MTSTGIVFRRLHAQPERDRARRLVQAGDLGLPPTDRQETAWFGLWDLTASDGADLVAVAALHPAGAGVVELAALAVPAALRRRGLGSRLLSEVINRMRAQGADRLVVRLPAGARDGRALLRTAGFLTDERHQCPEGSGVWLSLEL